jgi:hypothetical protein
LEGARERREGGSGEESMTAAGRGERSGWERIWRKMRERECGVGEGLGVLWGSTGMDSAWTS